MDCRAANAPSDRGGSEGGTGEAWPDSPHLHQKFLTRTYAKKYESGEAQINIDGKLGTGDTLYLINEQVNGDKKTDYSSEMKEIAIYDWVFDGFIWKGDAENGYTSATAYYESRNDDSYIKSVPATITETVTAPACTEDGKTTYQATVSADSSLDGIERSESKDAKITKALGHDWGEWTVTKQATYTEQGEETRICKNDPSHKETRTIDKIPQPQPAAQTITVTVKKAANPLAVSPKTAAVKYSKLKKKNQTLAVTKVINFKKKISDKKTYTLSSAKKGKKSFEKYFAVNKTNGKVTVKKGLKKGTYKVTVKVKANGNANYSASKVKTVTFTVRVK